MRRLALLLSLALLVGGCANGLDAAICEHCYCDWGTRDFRHPVSCTTIGREPECCLFLGS